MEVKQGRILALKIWLPSRCPFVNNRRIIGSNLDAQQNIFIQVPFVKNFCCLQQTSLTSAEQLLTILAHCLSQLQAHHVEDNYSNRTQGQDLTKHDWKCETRETGLQTESPERRQLHGFLLFPPFHSCDLQHQQTQKQTREHVSGIMSVRQLFLLLPAMPAYSSSCCINRCHHQYNPSPMLTPCLHVFCTHFPILKLNTFETLPSNPYEIKLVNITITPLRGKTQPKHTYKQTPIFFSPCSHKLSLFYRLC